MHGWVGKDNSQDILFFNFSFNLIKNIHTVELRNFGSGYPPLTKKIFFNFHIRRTEFHNSKITLQSECDKYSS